MKKRENTYLQLLAGTLIICSLVSHELIGSASHNMCIVLLSRESCICHQGTCHELLDRWLLHDRFRDRSESSFDIWEDGCLKYSFGASLLDNYGSRQNNPPQRPTTNVLIKQKNFANKPKSILPTWHRSKSRAHPDLPKRRERHVSSVSPFVCYPWNWWLCDRAGHSASVCDTDETLAKYMWDMLNRSDCRTISRSCNM